MQKGEYSMHKHLSNTLGMAMKIKATVCDTQVKEVKKRF